MSDSCITEGQILLLVREVQAKLTDDERKLWWNNIVDGYCYHCGRPTPSGYCHCINDE